MSRSADGETGTGAGGEIGVPATRERGRILAPAYAATTIGMFALIAFNAFESLAITTVMPTVARDLDGLGLYALAFASPLAGSVIGMVAAGLASDRTGPARPLVVSIGVFTAGLLLCALAPSMELLIVGRVVQGLGGGALVVGLYVLVGLVYPARMQPAVFASFAAAWVLPSLFGPAIAAAISSTLGWRWVFGSVVVLVAVGAALVGPALRGVRATDNTPEPGGRARLGWSAVAAVAVLAVELLGSHADALALLALVALGVVLVALRRLMPPGTLRLARGLPAVIGTRGLLAASFFCTQAYIAFVLQERWDYSPGQAGIALTTLGVVWASASQGQARLGDRLAHRTAMTLGTTIVLIGTLALVAAVALDAWAPAAIAAITVAAGGMGLAYPRSSVAMLAASTDADRGFNSSALTIADVLGAALALSCAGVAFATAERLDADPFLAVFAVSTLAALAGVTAARRTV